MGKIYKGLVTDIYCMKTISLKIEDKEVFDKFRGDLSFNKAIRLLLEDAETFNDDERDILSKQQKYYNAKIDDDLLDKLNNCRKYFNESHSDIILRLLKSKGY